MFIEFDLQKTYFNYRYKNCVSVSCVDIILGVMLMIWLFNGNKPALLGSSIMVWADVSTVSVHGFYASMAMKIFIRAL